MWEDKNRRKIETQKALESMPMALMKNYDGSTGMGGLNDGRYVIVKDGIQPQEVLRFETIDELSDAGWTLTS